MSEAAFQLIELNRVRADTRFGDIDGAGIGVAVLDTGLDYTHQLLDGNYVGGFDAVDNDADPQEFQSSHGTHVGGIVGAEDGRYGVAPEVDLLGVRVLGPNGGTGDDIAQGLQWVIDNQQRYNIQVVNMSLGGGFFTNPDDPRFRGYSVYEKVQELEQLGVTVVTAAGNSWKESETSPGPNVAQPAIFSTIAVGGVWEDSNPGRAAWAGGSQEFSTGADRVMAMSQRLNFPDMLFAPGAVIESTVPGDGIEGKAGTSMAAPMVAGVVALMQDAAQTFGGRYLTPAEVRDILRRTADTIVDGDDEDDNVVNLGVELPRMNAFNAIDAVYALFGGEVPPPPPGETGADPNGTLDTAIVGPTLGPADLGSGGAVTQLGERSYEETIGRDGPTREVGPQDVDMYRFEVTAPGTVTLTTSAVSGEPEGDTVLRLFDGSGAEIAANDDYGVGLFSQIQRQLAPGSYYVGVSGYGNSTYDPRSDGGRSNGGETGAYSLSFEISGGDPNGTLGGAVAVEFVDDNTPVYFPGLLGADYGDVVSTADVDIFKIVAPDDGRIFVDIDTPFDPTGTVTPGFTDDDRPFTDTYIRLFDAEGNLLGEADDAVATDRFFRQVEFDRGDGVLITGDNVFAGHDTDSFGWFDVARGEEFYIGVSSFTNSSYNATDLDGRPGAEPDAFYDLFVNFINNDQNGSIPQAFDVGVVNLEVGGPALEVSGAIGTDGERDADGNLVLDGSGRPVLAQVGDRDVDFLRITPQQSGLLEIDVDSFGRSNSIDEEALGPDDTTVGFEFDSLLKVFDANGVEITSNDDDDGLDPRVNIEVQGGQTYYVALTGYGNQDFDPQRLGSGPGGATGRYTYTARLVETQSIITNLSDGQIGNASITALPLGETVTGDIGRDASLEVGPTDVDLYSLTPTQSGRHRIETVTVEAFSADTFMRLFDASGTELAFDDNSAGSRGSLVEAELTAGQTYYVGVNGAGPDARAYDPLTGAGAAAATGEGGAYGLLARAVTGVTGSNVGEVLQGTAESETLEAFGGDDQLIGGLGADVLDGGAGTDFANYNGSTVGVQVDLLYHTNPGVSTASGGEAEGDTFISIEGVTATNFGDGVAGDDGDNRIFTWWGEDWVWGRDGNDAIDGGGDTDRLWGERGVDVLNGGDGFDFLDGGSGGDALGGDAGNDNLIGGTGDDWMWGGEGSDAFWIDAASLENGGHDRIMDFQDNSATATDWIRFEGVRYNQIVWYEQGSSAVIQVALDSGGSHYVEIMNFTLGQLSDQYYGHI